MSKYFKKNFFWNDSLKKNKGLPRPAYMVPEEFQFLKNDRLKLKNDFFLHKIIPVPWQSKPIFDEKKTVFNVIEENEQEIYKKSLCGYCGIKFNELDECSRWIGYTITDESYIPNDKQGPRLFSDTHPLHLKCMTQARIFCPFMRLLDDKEFEYGIYKNLRKNADDFILIATKKIPPAN